jgi:hypothetical protein
MDSSKATIKMGNVSVESQHHIRLLGVIVDNCLSWDQQINKVITDSRKLLQAAKMVRKYFTLGETVKIVTSLVFSRLYYTSEAWLLLTLKEKLFNLLHSQSQKILKVINKDLSYKQLHKQFDRATPQIFVMYHMCINFFNVMKFEGNISEERAKVIMNIMQANINDYSVFIRQNGYKCGLNNVSNP